MRQFRMAQIRGTDVRLLLPDRDPSVCCVGRPTGDGIRLGYEGWGSPDVFLDPSLPLDLCVQQLGLAGKFPKVTSNGLLNRIHGDCNLTHAARGLADLLAPGGRLIIEALATAEVARASLERMDAFDFSGAHVLERLCFGQPVDVSGLCFHQNLLSEARLLFIFDRAGVKACCTKSPSPTGAPRWTDDVRLPGIEQVAWDSGSIMNGTSEGLDQDRPQCVVTGCFRVSTKMDHNQHFFSRYCKDHYHEARTECDRRIRDAYRVVISVTKS